MSRLPFSLLTTGLLLFSSSYSFAYSIELQAVALGGRDPNQLELDLREVDGRTSAILDTGLVQGSLPGLPSASAFSGVDLVAGRMTQSGFAERGEVGDEQSTGASSQFEDLLSFSFAPGVSNATIGFVMEIEASGESFFGAFNARLGGVDAVLIDPNGRLRGEVTLSGATDLILDASTIFSCMTGPTESCSFSSTVFVALEPLPDGVSFTSEGGFNSVVPLPAAGWLLVSALGMLGWVGRK